MRNQFLYSLHPAQGIGVVDRANGNTRPVRIAKPTLGFALIALICFCCPLSAQTYYKWVDESGTVHYSANPPADRAYERVDTRAQVIISRAPESAATDSEESTSDPVQLPREAPPDPEQLRARCRQRQENLFWLQSNRRVILEAEDGSEQLMSQNEQDRMIEENRAFLQQWCQDVNLRDIPPEGPRDNG